MTDTTNNTNNSSTAATLTAEQTAEADFAKKWESRKKVIARVNDDQVAFTSFVSATFNDADPYKDWASENAPKLGPNVTLAMVESDDGENRLIAIPSKEAAFADEVVRDNLYRMFCNKLMNIAGKPDSAIDMFATVSGCFKARFDLAAFKDYARDVVSVLHEKGLRGITVPTLKIALSNAAFAKAQFPTMKPAQWDIIFAIFQKNAETNGQDTSILAHWKNTRDAMSDTGADVTFDMASFEASMAEGDEGDTTAA